MIDVRVARKTREADAVYSFELRAIDGKPLPTFAAGAHIDVHLGNGLVRQYSLYNSPDETDRYCIAVANTPQSRGGSRHLCETVQEGDILRVDPPRNLFPLDETAAFSLLVAGGIGITPILSMAARLHQLGKDFAMHYCGRTASAMAFRNALDGAPYADRVTLHFDDAPQAQTADIAVQIAKCSAGSHLYVCGPSGFMDNVLTWGRDAGWQEECLHREYFAAAPLTSPTGDEPFTLRLVRSQRDLLVPAGKTAADILLESGVDIRLSCEQGICGTCLTPVVAGTPDHRDLFLTKAEHDRNDCFTPCCSRSKSPVLMIDL